MKVTVWGDSWFLGSHVCGLLIENGHEVKIADTSESQLEKMNGACWLGTFLIMIP